jgi:hypothetical protein
VLNAARLILRSVETPHRLDLVDLADDPRLRTALEPTYDIVQLLAVYHTWTARGVISQPGACWQRSPSAAAKRSSSRRSPLNIPAIIEVLSAAQFRLERETTSPARRVKHVVFYRE